MFLKVFGKWQKWMVIIAERCWHLQNQMVILRGVLKVKFTKYCTCAAGNPGGAGELSRDRPGFFIILELEPYMLEAYLGKNANWNKTNHISLYFSYSFPMISYDFPMISYDFL